MNKQQIENCTPGTCTKCSAHADQRNTAGQCIPCHNAGYHEYEAKRKAWREEQKNKGKEYWKSRGIKPGDKVYGHFPTFFGTVHRVVGIAKVGAVGAYVSAPHEQKGYLSPHAFAKQG